MTHEPVRNRLNISTSSANRVIEIFLVHRPRVIAAESLVVVVILSIQLLQTIPRLGALGAVANHLENAALGVVGVESDAGVGLHDTRVTDTVVGGTDADVAAGFLHDDAKDDAGIDAGLRGDTLNGSLDEADLAGAVVEGHQGGVLGPKGVIVGPGAGVWKVGGRAAVWDVAATDAGAAGGGGGWGASGAREVDDLANSEGAGVYAWVGSLEGADGGTVGLGDGPQGVA